MNLSHVFFLCFFVGIFSLLAQEYPQDFVSPIDIPIKLVGNFGELRKNHFHTGLDIKTNEEEGHAIFSIGEGFVSRVNVSSVGYGNVLYIDHPSGHTSVYAHLQQFSPLIAEYVKRNQLEQQKSEIELRPNKDELKVSKGEQIALSGNSGSSQGPHLHFEIRDTKTEDALNPFLFGFSVSDNKNPMLQQVYIYPIEGEIEGKNERFLLHKNQNELHGFGKFGIGIKAYDQHDFLDNINGVYSIKIVVNGKEIYVLKKNRFPLTKTRIIHSVIDYLAYLDQGGWIYQCFTAKGNDLKSIEKTENFGFIDIKNSETYSVSIIVEDFAGNQSQKDFVLTGMEGEIEKKDSEKEKNETTFFTYNKENKFKNENIELIFPKGVFYDDVDFYFKETEEGYEIHDSAYPALDYFTIKAKPKKIDEADLEKAILVRYQKKGRHLQKSYEVGVLENGKIVKEMRDFGIFTFEVDKNPPTIVNKNPKNGKINSQLRFAITDYMSGIENYTAYIDDKWVVAVFDKKYNSLTIPVDETIAAGEHKLLLQVTDKVKNTSEINLSFEKL